MMKTVNNANDRLAIKETHDKAVSIGKIFLYGTKEEFRHCITQVEESEEFYLKKGYLGVETDTACKDTAGCFGSVLLGYRDLAADKLHPDFLNKNEIESKLNMLMDTGKIDGYRIEQTDNNIELILFRFTEKSIEKVNEFINYQTYMPNVKRKEVAVLTSLNKYNEVDINNYCTFRHILRTCKKYGELYRYPQKEIDVFYEGVNQLYKNIAQTKNIPYVPIGMCISDETVKQLFAVTESYDNNRLFRQNAKNAADAVVDNHNTSKCVLI